MTIYNDSDEGSIPPWWLRPIWTFHGLLDETVPAEESIKMARAAQRSGANVRLTIYPDAHHEAWEQAYADDRMWA